MAVLFAESAIFLWLNLWHEYTEILIFVHTFY